MFQASASLETNQLPTVSTCLVPSSAWGLVHRVSPFRGHTWIVPTPQTDWQAITVVITGFILSGFPYEAASLSSPLPLWSASPKPEADSHLTPFCRFGALAQVLHPPTRPSTQTNGSRDCTSAVTAPSSPHTATVTLDTWPILRSGGNTPDISRLLVTFFPISVDTPLPLFTIILEWSGLSSHPFRAQTVMLHPWWCGILCPEEQMRGPETGGTLIQVPDRDLQQLRRSAVFAHLSQFTGSYGASTNQLLRGFNCSSACACRSGLTISHCPRDDMLRTKFSLPSK
ncbi:uncharacterized protein LY79DRAFT_576310 [Colletotrichum navitas]|uniref:Uncharacterized protein n=1 Tax=Colletotrichum navitas TaxID=681940 RepID=A0AAD8V9H1_9PEZI|nr:uncharacterized protein LY79DRAFT_576310 [Colletotrichum navitas]KAK1597979.1 hypothetical protein LY79DRAFT_576310 [Colletotrichum navitas]